jgi:hypothetical protein
VEWLGLRDDLNDGGLDGLGIIMVEHDIGVKPWLPVGPVSPQALGPPGRMPTANLGIVSLGLFEDDQLRDDRAGYQAGVSLGLRTWQTTAWVVP